jgi:hypothetical protein
VAWEQKQRPRALAFLGWVPPFRLPRFHPFLALALAGEVDPPKSLALLELLWDPEKSCWEELALSFYGLPSRLILRPASTENHPAPFGVALAVLLI